MPTKWQCMVDKFCSLRLKLNYDTFPLFRELEGKISLGRGLLEKLATPKLRNVQGLAKLEKKVRNFNSQFIDHVFEGETGGEISRKI